MAGTYPTTPEFASIGFSSEQATITSTTDSGKMFSVQVDGQRFKFSASYPPMTRDEFAPVIAFIMKQPYEHYVDHRPRWNIKNLGGFYTR